MSRSIAISLAMVLSAAPAWAQGQNPRPTPFVPAPARDSRPAEASPAASVAARFWEVGYETAHAGNVTGPEADQGIILLTAAKSLNNQLVGVEPLLLKLASRHSEKDYTEPVLFWLQKYSSESADRVVVADAVQRLLDRLGTQDERRSLLEKLAFKIKNKNAAIDSDLALSLGLLANEKGAADQAKYYLVQAYNNNKFNRRAFAELSKLAPNEIGPATHLEHLRLMLRENPLDLDGALYFAGYAERLGLHDVAAQAYSYCTELFRYLYPSESMPQNIYLPLAISCYNTNTKQGMEICLVIAEGISGDRAANGELAGGQVQDSTPKRFDILLEAIAGRAALKLGQPDLTRQIFARAAQQAEALMSPGQGQISTSADAEPVGPVNAKQLAWFYSFADPNAVQALDWANKAYSAEPNSPAAGVLLAYALSMNNRMDLVKPLFAASEQSQIADLVRARVQLAAGNKPDAIQTLKAAIARDASSLPAERAKEVLRQLGGGYAPPVDPMPLATFLSERFGKAIVPPFVAPDKMVDVQFAVRGRDFAYGRDFEGVVTLVNKSSEPLVITDNSLFQGNIRVSARVTGDLKRDIPNVVSETIRTALVVPPGKSLVHTLRLSTGDLRDILVTCPQANLEIQFTLYLDPVITERGEITNHLVDVKPVTASVTRPGMKITRDLLAEAVGRSGSTQGVQGIQTALLFTGLLKEQNLMVEKGTLYTFAYEPWMPAQFRTLLTNPSGLILGGGDNEWVVKTNTMAYMLSMPLDPELAGVVLKNLNHPQWPVRLMAVYLLGKEAAGSAGDVLAWVAQNDKDELVRSMASSLRAESSAIRTP